MQEPAADEATRRSIALALLGGALWVGAWWVVLLDSRLGVEMGLGALVFPTRTTSSMNGMFLGVAVLAVPLWYRALSALSGALLRSRFAKELSALPEARWVVTLSFFAFAAAMLVRNWVLRGATLSDDESVYLFGTQLLAEGRLWVESPTPRLFFDHIFMVNDGRLYPQFAMGWPALLLPFWSLGLHPLLNPLLSALTVPAVYGLGDALGGRLPARLSTVLFVFSPMVATAGATLDAHTSALALATWLVWVLVRRSDASSARWDLLVGTLAGVLLLVRPDAGLSLGLLVCAQWLLVRGRGSKRALALVPVVLAFALFAAINVAQTGLWWKTAAARAVEYAEENQWRFTVHNQATAEMALWPLGDRFDTAIALLFRLNADLFGFPLSLLPLMLLRLGRAHRPLVLTLTGFFVFHLFDTRVGIDTFAPTRVLEASGLLVVLTASALVSLQARAPNFDVAAAATAAFLVGWCTLVPMRAFNVHRLAQDVLAPTEFIEAQRLERAVVFNVDLPVQCGLLSTHFVNQLPPNPPDARTASVLWVNHLTIAEDRELARTAFPERSAWVLVEQNDCELKLLALDSVEAGRVSPSTVSTEMMRKAPKVE